MNFPDGPYPFHGCSSGYCVCTGYATGQHTNSSCLCDKHQRGAAAEFWRMRAQELEAEIASYKAKEASR